MTTTTRTGPLAKQGYCTDIVDSDIDLIIILSTQNRQGR